MAMDRDQFDMLLAQSAGNMGCIDLLEHVVTPLMQWVGDKWHDGELKIAHEHMATAGVRAYLERLYISLRSEPTGPGVVLTTLPGQRHEIGILSCAVVAALEQWRVHYFGLELPLADIAQSAADLRVRLVGLSVSSIGNEHELHAHLAELRDLLPSDIDLVVGGAGIVASEAIMEHLGIRCARSLRQFQDFLRTY